jgi:hypothetical protein
MEQPQIELRIANEPAVERDELVATGEREGREVAIGVGARAFG